MKRFISIFFAVLILCSPVWAGTQTVSSTTGTSLIAQARIYLDEPASAIRRWTEAELLQYLNNGTVDIAAKTKDYQSTGSITLVADTVEYTPSFDYLDVIAVVLNPVAATSKGLVKGNISSVARATQGTTPVYWYSFAGKIGIYPAYSSVTSQTVTVYYTKFPEAIVAGGTVPLPAYLDRALVYYITAQALLKDKRPQEAANYLTLYNMELSQYRQDISEADNETVDPIR